MKTYPTIDWELSANGLVYPWIWMNLLSEKRECACDCVRVYFLETLGHPLAWNTKGPYELQALEACLWCNGEGFLPIPWSEVK